MKRWILIAGLVSVLASASPLSAQYEEQVYKPNLTLGFWFGPVAPIPGTKLADELGTYLGGGGFARIDLPITGFKVESGISANDYRSDAISKLFTAPLYVAFVYKVPLQVQLELLFKLGGGAVYLSNYPEEHENIIPLGFVGVELSFAAGRRARVGIRMDYNLLYEQHLSIPPGAPSNFQLINGHMLNIGLQLSFRVGKI